MRFYRVAHVALDWKERGLRAGHNGHPLYVHREGQGHGRFDLPEHFLALYLARQSQAAVGERFQALNPWTADYITRPRRVGAVELQRCLVTVDTDRVFRDLDDAAVLLDVGWRPSDVVNKDREKTQELALMEWLARDGTESGGLMWWSSLRPAWTLAMAWAEPVNPEFRDIDVVDVEPLQVTQPAVVTASRMLGRLIV